MMKDIKDNNQSKCSPHHVFWCFPFFWRTLYKRYNHIETGMQYIRFLPCADKQKVCNLLWWWRPGGPLPVWSYVQVSAETENIVQLSSRYSNTSKTNNSAYPIFSKHKHVGDRTRDLHVFGTTVRNVCVVTVVWLLTSSSSTRATRCFLNYLTRSQSHQSLLTENFNKYMFMRVSNI